MRMLPILFFAVALAATGAPAAARSSAELDAVGQAKLDKAIAGRIAGKPVDCINQRQIQSSEVIDHTAILYRMIGGQLYVNQPDGGRESLDRDDVLVTKTYSTELCSIDTVQLIDRYSHFYRGFVGLGPFVPYSKAPKAE